MLCVLKVLNPFKRMVKKNQFTTFIRLFRYNIPISFIIFKLIHDRYFCTSEKIPIFFNREQLLMSIMIYKCICMSILYSFQYLTDTFYDYD